MKKQNISGVMRHAIERHQMISDGDFVAVGLSGGKDSMALLHALKMFQRYSDKKFKLAALSIDPGFENTLGNVGLDYDKASVFCEKIDVPLHIARTDIAEIVFEIRDEKNPCSLCANMRRGALATEMNKRGMNKLALGHHEDDLVATFLMNLIYGGRLDTLQPKSFLDVSKITVIRPLIYASEKSIKSYVAKNQIPVAKSPCPMDKRTARENANKVAAELYNINEHSRSAIVNAVRSLIDK